MTPHSVQRVEPDEARILLESGAGYAYLDVRSVEEFAAGHVPGAVNIPLLERNPGGPGLRPNPRFVEDVEAGFPKDAKLITACQRGGRSLKAAEILIARGYTSVIDMRGGYDGEIDASGMLTCPGWARRGFPTTSS
jgi:rhodanese-related sulfurtransferase